MIFLLRSDRKVRLLWTRFKMAAWNGPTKEILRLLDLSSHLIITVPQSSIRSQSRGLFSYQSSCRMIHDRISDVHPGGARDPARRTGTTRANECWDLDKNLGRVESTLREIRWRRCWVAFGEMKRSIPHLPDKISAQTQKRQSAETNLARCQRSPARSPRIYSNAIRNAICTFSIWNLRGKSLRRCNLCLAAAINQKAA